MKLVDKGQFERAVKVYLQVVGEDDRDVRTWLKIGDLYTKLRKNHEAAETYEKVARLYLRKGDARRALPRLQVCFKADPRDVETLGLLADAFEALAQKIKAVSVLKELARVHTEDGNSGERDAAWRRIAQLDPSDPDARSAFAPQRQTMPGPLPTPAPVPAGMATG